MHRTIQTDGTPVHPRTKHDHFDKIALRLPRTLGKAKFETLRKHSRSADQRPGHHIRGDTIPILLTVVCPTRRALELLSKLEGAIVNYVEVARDIETASKSEAHELAEYALHHFVQPKHGRRKTVVFETSVYTGPNKPGHRFVWYWDRGSKVALAPRVLHFECRAHGVAAVRRVLKVKRPSDLLTFDFEKFWQQHLRVYTVDLARLGRFNENRRTGRRRKSPRVSPDRWSYSDRRIGSMIFRRLGRTAQGLVDGYGRGPYLRRLQVHPLICATSHQVTSHVPCTEPDKQSVLDPAIADDRQDMRVQSVSTLEGSLDMRERANSKNHGGQTPCLL